MVKNLEFTSGMLAAVFLSFLLMSFFMGMLIHSAIMYEDRAGMDRHSRRAWVLCMVAGTGITGWMFAYGYYINFVY